MRISGKANRIALVAGSTRCPITVHSGPWIAGVNPDLIKIRPKKLSFPAEVSEALEVENNSDIQTDYFERDCLRLLPGHPLYEAAKAAVA
jgi:hypothetical protein